MPFYAIVTSPLISIQSGIKGTKQVWYTDNTTAAGSLEGLHIWWDTLANKGCPYG